MSDHEDLPKLKKAKSFSDDANWHEKHVLLRSMLAEHPDRWEVDQDDGHQHAIGIRHESGFKFHLPREQVVGPVTAPAEKSAMSLMPSLSDMATSRLMKAISEDQVKLGPDGEIIVAPEEEAPLTPEEQAQDDMAAIAEQVAAMQRQRKAARPAYYDPRDWTAKTASAVVSPSLLTYVPGAALEAIRKNGLLSGNELAKPENRHLLELARGGDEGDSADAWLERRASRLKEQPWNTSYQGPSAIFGEADPDKITDKHPTKRFKSVPIRIKLQELLAKYPNTKLHGSELVPFNEDYDNLSAAQKDEHVKARHHDLTPEEITALIDRGRNPKDMWQHYNDPEGNMYAGNVPHTHIITPHGRIDPEFLDFGDLPSALELPEDGKYHPRSVKSAHIKCPNCQTTEGHLKLAGEAIICRECNRRSDITEWEEANPETSGSEKKATGAGATPVQPVAPPTPVKPLKTPTPVQPETMVVAPHTPAATGAKPNPGIYKAPPTPVAPVAPPTPVKPVAPPVQVFPRPIPSPRPAPTPRPVKPGGPPAPPQGPSFTSLGAIISDPHLGYGDADKAIAALRSARAYRAANPSLNFINDIDPATVARKIPVVRERNEDPDGADADYRAYYDSIRMYPSRKQMNGESDPEHDALYGDLVSHEGLHATQREAIRANPTEARRSLAPRSEEDKLRKPEDFGDYLTKKTEVMARLPRLNRLWVRAGNPFPTTQDDAAKIFSAFGIHPPGKPAPSNPPANWRPDVEHGDIDDLIRHYRKWPESRQREFYQQVLPLQPGLTMENEQPGQFEKAASAFQEAKPAPLTGPEGIKAKLASLDLEALAAEQHAYIKSGKVSKRDKAVKILNIIEGLKRNKVKPEELMIHAVPVIPAVYRPFAMAGGTFIPGDANELYKDLFTFQKLHRETHKELGPEAGNEAGLQVYNAVKALYGYGEPVNPKTASRGVTGFFKSLVGTSPKYSVWQRQLISKPMDNISRATVSVNPELGIDQVGIPRDHAWKSYAPYIQGRLVGLGYSPGDAVKAIRDRTPAALQALERELPLRPGIVSRAPAWHKFNALAQHARLVDGDSIQINPFITTSQNMDFDGDQVNFSVPASDAAVREAHEKLLPSKMVFGIRDPDVVINNLKHEQILGSYAASQRPAQKQWKFGSKDEAISALKNGTVPLHDDVTFPGSEKLGTPLHVEV